MVRAPTERSDRSTELIGRTREVQALAGRIDAAEGGGGGTLLLRGAAGIGKSSLLDAAREHAAAKRFRILSTTGIQSESHLPFAGLHQLLRPVLGDMDRLPEAHAQAIRSAFGLGDEVAPGPFQIALAILHLLGECADTAPVLLLVDDAQWLDRSTADALAFVARRLDSDPIVLVAAVRDDFESPLLEARLAELRVDALSDVDAAALLDVRAADLPRPVRERILGDAAGNPLALIELPIALAATHADVPPSATLPLTSRLEKSFTDRLSSLAPGTRRVLRVAAIDVDGTFEEILTAASKLEGSVISAADVEDASRSGFVEINGPRLRFRHPLMRSAIRQTMSLVERQAAHTALAAGLEDDPDRRAWHRAAAALGPDDEIADELDAFARRALTRGGFGVSLEARERAAHLTRDPAKRGRRLLDAAYRAYVFGRPRDVGRLLGQIDDQELRAPDRPLLAWLRELFGQDSWSGASRIAAFVEIAERSRLDGNIDSGLEALAEIAFRCWWSNPDEPTRAGVIEAAERFPVPEDDTRQIRVLALAGPVERGAIVLERLDHFSKDVDPSLGGPLGNLGNAALAVGDFVRAERFLDAYILFCRSRGVLGGLATSLTPQAWAKIQRGDWKAAASVASEAARLAEEIGMGRWKTTADLAAATVAAYRGDVDAAEALAADGERAFLPRGAHPLLALVQYARGAAALAAGRHDEAYRHLRRIFDARDNAHHPHVRSWALVDLVEAAAYSGNESEAAGFVAELESIGARTRAPVLMGALQYARPVLSADSDDDAFTGDATLANWPFTRARLQLAYGARLRRQRRSADARAPLRAARDAFDALGAVPWGERARQELRASGETSRRRSRDLLDALSPQEFQIAQLAAAGLSNKEIGRQLFLSHRTVAFHLYRVFPKLGIAARSHLSAALKGRSAPSS
jgi:DNA-binding CsgD family transcriptional regulator